MRAGELGPAVRRAIAHQIKVWNQWRVPIW
jgi:hypothetical protein